MEKRNGRKGTNIALTDTRIIWYYPSINNRKDEHERPTKRRNNVYDHIHSTNYRWCSKSRQKHITRRGKWDMKCKFNESYILYFDRDRGNYRYASKKLADVYISIGLNKEEMKVVN